MSARNDAALANLIGDRRFSEMSGNVRAVNLDDAVNGAYRQLDDWRDWEGHDGIDARLKERVVLKELDFN